MEDKKNVITHGTVANMNFMLKLFFLAPQIPQRNTKHICAYIIAEVAWT